MNGQSTSHVSVAEAIADLAALRSSDPAARHAVHAIRLTRLILESFWTEPSSPVGADG